MYQINRLGVVSRKEDGATIPSDLDNRDWRKYQAWLAAGNTPEPAETDAEVTDRLWADLRAKRDRLLLGSEWLVQRHQEQVELGQSSILDAQTYQALLAYRQALRDLPGNTPDPANPTWPNAPV
ncbi:MAG: phage tail assembly chaperone [bacterium]|nr:phage tail assembly chaperone [bacterium]